MKFNELIERMISFNDKIDAQYGEVMKEDEPESEELEGSIEWWHEYLADKYFEDLAEAEKLKKRAAQFEARAKKFEKSAEWRRQAVYTLVKMSGKPIKTTSASSHLSRPAKTVHILNMDAVDVKFRVDKWEPNKTAIKVALEGGETLEYAKLVDGKEFVVIK